MLFSLLFLFICESFSSLLFVCFLLEKKWEEVKIGGDDNDNDDEGKEEEEEVELGQHTHCECI